MTQSEFYSLTGVNVSESEFWYIHDMYMNNDLDKYEFCAMWRKLNRARVDKAKADAKAKAQRQHDLDVAWRLLERWQCKRRARLDVWSELATDHMTASQEQALKRLGVNARGFACNESRHMGYVWDDIVRVLHEAV